MLSIIAAISRNNVIGTENKLPWNLSADLQYFREKTRGHAIIMGRKTFESIGRPLPNRTNIILTRDESYKPEGTMVVHSVEEALEEAHKADPEPFIIGGAQVYQLFMDKAERLFITHVECELEGDAYFPEINLERWEKVSEEKHFKDAENEFDYSFCEYLKI